MRRRPHMLGLVLLGAIVSAGCVDNVDSTPQTGTAQELQCGVVYGPQTVVVRSIWFVGAEDGVTQGRNLDGRTSDRTDELSCKKPDLTSPNGQVGIDNQLSVLLPLIETAAGGTAAIESTFQRAISTGSLLLAMEMVPVASESDTECLRVSLTRADGVPMVGADGLLEASQTLERKPEVEPGVVEFATVDDGQIVAGPLDLWVPLQVDTYNLTLSVRQAVFEYSILEDGTVRGIIAGALVIEEMRQLLQEIEDGTDLLRIIERVLSQNADLAPDEEGVCQQLSLTLGFEAVPAYFYE